MTTKDAAKKTEDTQLRDYELILIIRPEIVEEKLTATLDTVTHFITNKGGSVTGMEPWGKKRLAFPVKHSTEGNFVLARFKLPPKASKELESNLRISEGVLRHLLINPNS